MTHTAFPRRAALLGAILATVALTACQSRMNTSASGASRTDGSTSTMGASSGDVELPASTPRTRRAMPGSGTGSDASGTPGSTTTPAR